MLVTPDLLLRESLAEHFFMAGWKTLEETHPNDVLRRVVKYQPRVILLDDRTIEAVEVIQAWRRSSLLRHVVCVILTENMTPEAIAQYRAFPDVHVVSLFEHHPATVVKLVGKLYSLV
jgi:DNA-binding response OmpR family regulator